MSISREIHIEGQFSDAEWAQIHVALATMKRGFSKPAALPEGCIEAEVLTPELP